MRTPVKTLLALTILIAFMATTANAQPRKRIATRKMLARTTVVIQAAHNELKESKNFTGDFSRAVANQRFAIKLFKERKFDRAAMHSRLARMYAFKVIAANNKPVQPDWQMNKEENEDLKDQILPSDDDLNKEMEKAMPDVKYDDASLLEDSLDDLDIDDLTGN